MDNSKSSKVDYFIAGSIGALMGGTLVLLASHVIPKMMSRFMSQMMANMAKQMGGEGCKPSEM